MEWNAIRKHGKDNFEREIVDFFVDRKQLYAAERLLVDEDFIARDDTYNMKLGGNGGFVPDMVVVRDQEDNLFTVHRDEPRLVSGELVSATCGQVVVQDANGRRYRVSVHDARFLSGELISTHKGNTAVRDKDGNVLYVSVDDPSYLSGEFVSVNTGVLLGKVMSRDVATGRCSFVSVDDPRLKTGELEYTTTGMLTVKDADGNTFRTSVNDPRYLSKELQSQFKDTVLLRDLSTGKGLRVGRDDERVTDPGFEMYVKGQVIVQDAEGNRCRVSVDDPRYLSGELHSYVKGTSLYRSPAGEIKMLNKDDERVLSGGWVSCGTGRKKGEAELEKLRAAARGTLAVKDKDGNKTRVRVDDPRYLSGELVGVNTGTKKKGHSADAKRRIGLANIGKRWFFHAELRKNARFSADQTEQLLASGWQLGKRRF